MMADELTFHWSEIQICIAETDADLIPVPGELELHGRYADVVSCRLHALVLYLSQI